MKKIIIAIIFANSFIVANGQKQTESFELVKLLLPDSSATAKMFGWNCTAEINAAVKWLAAAPKLYGKDFSKEGKVNILLNGKPMVCEDNIGGSKHPCKWTVVLAGKKQGYSSFSLGAADFPVEEPGKEIAYLFPKNKGSFTFIKDCMEGAIMWSRLYKVTIPGKKTCWLMVEYESMSATASQYETSGIANTIGFTFYFDKAEAESKCQ